MALQEEEVALPGPSGLACFVVSIGSEAAQAGDRLVDELRNAGIPAANAFEERPLKAQLKMADRSGAAYAAAPLAFWIARHTPPDRTLDLENITRQRATADYHLRPGRLTRHGRDRRERGAV